LPIVVSVTALRDRDAAMKQRGAAEARAHVADSLLRISSQRLAHVDTVLVQGAAAATKWLTRVDTIKTLRVDTVYAVGDTAHHQPLVQIPAGRYTFFTDTLAPSCKSLTQDCAAFRKEAYDRFALYESRINSTATSVCPSRLPAVGGGFAAGFAAGVVVGKRF
jgi:hypothetical protein